MIDNYVYMKKDDQIRVKRVEDKIRNNTRTLTNISKRLELFKDKKYALEIEYEELKKTAYNAMMCSE